MKKDISQLISLLILTLFIGLGSVASFAWTPPTATPPGNNTPAPLNSSTSAQAKGGPVVSGSTYDVNGTSSMLQLFSFGDMTITDDLTVAGLLIGQTGWSSGLRPVCINTSHKLHICAPICGNTFTEQGEQCDDGGTVNGDGCSSTCQNEAAPVCGNNIIEPGEQCDDGGTVNGDGCSSTCQNEAAPVGSLDLANGHFSGNPVYGDWRDVNTGQIYHVVTVGNPGSGYQQVPWGDYEWLGGDVTTEVGCPVPSDPPDIWPAVGTIQTISPATPVFSASVGCH